MAKPPAQILIQTQRGQVLQEQIGGPEQRQPLFHGRGFERFETNRIGYLQRPDRHATQAGQVGTAAKPFSQVLGKDANVGAFAAGDENLERVLGGACYIELVDVDAARGPFDIDALSGKRVKWPAIDLDGAVHRWHLLDWPGQGIDGIAQRLLIEIRCRHLAQFALGVARAAVPTQTQGGQIGFAGFKQRIGEFGGFPQAYRQQTRGKRIESAGMPCFGATKQAPDSLHRDVGRHA